MLEVKIIDSLRQYDFHLFKQAILFLIFSLVPVFFSFLISFDTLTDNFLDLEENCNNSFDFIVDLQCLGQAIYNDYIFCVLLGGLVLLIAILGAILLTLNLKAKKEIKLVPRQLARSENFLAFFK